MDRELPSHPTHRHHDGFPSEGRGACPEVEVAANHGTRPKSKSAAEAIFHMVVALMWSDGTLSDEEVQRGRAVAHALQVGPLAGGVFGAMAEGPLPFNELGFDALGDVERQTAYALSAWTAAPELATADRYRGFLHALGVRLALTAEQVTRLLALVLAIDERNLPPSQAAPELVRAVAQGV